MAIEAPRCGMPAATPACPGLAPLPVGEAPPCAGLREDLGLPPDVIVHGVLGVDWDPVARWSGRLPPGLLAVCAKRQREYLLGRYCASAALRQAGFAGPGWLPMGGDKLPCWPDGWLGSISHAGQGAVAAVASRACASALGVDMEVLIDAAILPGITRLVAHPDELALVSGLGQQHGLTLLFSAKEALYKALYPRVREFFDFTAARAVSLGAGELVLRLTVDWGEHWPAGSELRIRFAFRGEHVFTCLLLAGGECPEE